jgi:hypothetical protein
MVGFHNLRMADSSSSKYTRGSVRGQMQCKMTKNEIYWKHLIVVVVTFAVKLNPF